MTIHLRKKRFAYKLADWIYQSSLTREAYALKCTLASVANSVIRRNPGAKSRVQDLLQAARITRWKWLRACIRPTLASWIRERTREGRDRRPAGPRPLAASPLPRLSTGLIVKLPGPEGEKGVLLLGMEGELANLIRAARETSFFQRYDVVVLSSWSPANLPFFSEAAGLSEDPLYVGISNTLDTDILRMLDPAIVPIPLMACDWLNPDEFRPLSRCERDIDILMVANCAEYKRHWLLFEALRKLPRNLNVVLIGGEFQGRTVEDVKEEARIFGVKQALTFLGAVPVLKVYEFQARARVSVVLSRREGSCVVAAESLFADTPVGISGDSHVGAMAHINQNTGRILLRKQIARELGELVETSGEFSPRAWAIEHISCRRSSSRLDQILKQEAIRRGRPWSRDITPLFWRYFRPRHLNASDGLAMAVEVEDLRRRYGLEIPSLTVDVATP